MTELVHTYILHKKKKRKNATKNWPSQFHGWTPASSFLEAKLLQQVYALDQTKMQPKIVMLLSAF